jgi:tellurite resistance protein TerC
MKRPSREEASCSFRHAGVRHKLRFLKYGLGLILVFVGPKMVWLNDAFGGKFPIVWSLGLIGTLLTMAVLASLAIPPRAETKSPDAA